MTTVRWKSPAWLSENQAQVYCSLPPFILRALVNNKIFRRSKNKISRDSIDRALLGRDIIFWGQKS